jgi:hypothetical protein
MTDPGEVTTPGREPDDSMRSVWKGKGQHRSTPHSDHTAKCGQIWHKQIARTFYPACDLVSRQVIAVYQLGQFVCDECGTMVVYDHKGLACCDCTIWNDGQPRPRRAPNPKPEAVRMRQWQKFGRRC